MEDSTISLRLFCQHVVCPSIPIHEGVIFTALPHINVPTPPQPTGRPGIPLKGDQANPKQTQLLQPADVEEFVVDCASAARDNFSQALKLTLESFAETLSYARHVCGLIQLELDVVDFHENANKRQVKSKQKYLESRIRDLEAAIAYLESKRC